MDRRLRSRYRELLEDPGDPDRAEALRNSLGHADPTDAAEILDALIGGYFACASWENLEALERRHLRFVGSGLLAPLAPEAVAPIWSRKGTLLAVTQALVLVEERGGGLAALDLRSGDLLWRVPGLLEGVERLDPDQGRRERLGWAVARWGAVEVVAEFDAPLTYRRRGRYDAELGRVTERAPVDRLEAGVWIRLQVARPEGGWSPEPPSLILEEAGGEEGLCEGNLTLSSWDDSLYELELDANEARFAIRTLEQDHGEGHAFELRSEPTPRIDPIPWNQFPPSDDVAEPGALEEVLLQKVSRGDMEWTLELGAGRLSCGGDRWGALSEGELGAELDLIPYTGCAWILGPGPRVRVFRPGQEPLALELGDLLDGRSVGGREGVRGFGVERGLLLQGGSEIVTFLSSDP